MNERAFALLGAAVLLAACNAETRLLDIAQAASEAEQLDCDVDYAKYVNRKFDGAGCDRSREKMTRARLELDKAGISENRIEATISLGQVSARARLDDARRTWERENPSISAKEKKAKQELAAASFRAQMEEAMAESQRKEAEVAAAARRREARRKMEARVNCADNTDKLATTYRLVPPDMEVRIAGPRSTQRISSNKVCEAVIENQRSPAPSSAFRAIADDPEIEAPHDRLTDSTKFVLSVENKTDKLMVGLEISCVGSYFDAHDVLVIRQNGSVYKSPGVAQIDSLKALKPGETDFATFFHTCIPESVPFARSEVLVKIDGFTLADPSCEVGMAGVACPGDLFYQGERNGAK